MAHRRAGSSRDLPGLQRGEGGNDRPPLQPQETDGDEVADGAFVGVHLGALGEVVEEQFAFGEMGRVGPDNSGKDRRLVASVAAVVRLLRNRLGLHRRGMSFRCPAGAVCAALRPFSDRREVSSTGARERVGIQTNR